MLLKAGVDISKLRAPIRKKLNTIKTIIRKIEDKELVVTSTYEGTHSAGSLHYAHLAIDIQKNTRVKQTIAALKIKLGVKYDVIEETSHIHIEYDPK